MKKFLYLLLATAMLATFGCTGDTNTNSVGNPNPNQFQPKGTVSGVLVDACTNEPIANADVYIMDKKATTNSVGMFTIKKVPANTAVGNEPDNTALGLPLGSGTSLGSNGLNSWDTYNVVIDLSKVNAERAKLLGATLYPSIAYHTVKVSYTSLGETDGADATATNHDTPVDGFVANIKPMVGKLSATLNIEAVNGYNGSVLSGATVQLISLSPFDGFNTPNNVTGNLVNTIATATTGTDGKVSFHNVEAKHIFYAKVTWTNPANGHVWTGRAGFTQGDDGDGDVELNGQLPVVWTECDGTTTNFYTVGPNAPIQLFDDQKDIIAPYIESVSPANLSDIGESSAQNVVFTFSEVLKPTQYLLNTTPESSTVEGIYKDIQVEYQGPKSGNIAYTMAWDSTTAPKVLTVTFATAKSSKYHVDMWKVIDNPNVMDTNGNLADDAPDYLEEAFEKTTFTTGGGLDVTAPVVSRVGATNNIQWLPVANAMFYRVYIAEVRDGVTFGYTTVYGTGGSTHETAFTTFDTTPLLNVPPFNEGEVKVSYLVKVVTVNSDGTESAASAPVTIDDQTRPTIVSATGRGAIGALGADATVTGTLVVTFSEVMNKTTINSASAYGFQFSGAAVNVTVTFGTPVITYVANASVATIPYTISTNSTGSLAAGTVSVTNAGTDLNGNIVSNSPFLTTP
jgi:hypothetical protein